MRTKIVAACLWAVAAACGDDNSNDGADTSDAAAQTDAGAAADAGSIEDASHEHEQTDAGGSNPTSVADLPLPCDETVSLVDFKLKPATLTVASGAVLCATNDGAAPHDLTVRDSKATVVAHTLRLNPGEVGQFKLDADSGDYVMFCSVPGHESLGMKGTLTVR